MTDPMASPGSPHEDPTPVESFSMNAIAEALASYSLDLGLNLAITGKADNVEVKASGLSDHPYPLASLSEVTARGSDSLLNALNSQGFSTEGFMLSDFEMSILNGEHKAVTSLSATVTTTVDWAIIPSVIELSNVSVDFTILNPYNEYCRQIVYSFNGEFTIGHGSPSCQINVSVSFPDFTIYGELTPDSIIDLGALLSHFLPELDVTPFAGLEITGFNIRVNPRDKSYYLSLQITDDWTLFTLDGAPLKLTGGSLALNTSSDTFDIRIGGSVDLFGTDIFMNAHHGTGQNGWQLNGGLDEGQTVDLSTLVEGALSITSLPDFLSDVQLDALQASLNTGTEAYSVQGSLALEFSNESVGDITLSPVTCSAQFQSGSPSPTGSLEGETALEGHKLVVRYDFAPANRDLEFSYDGFSCSIHQQHGSQGSPPEMETIVELKMGQLRIGELLSYVLAKIEGESEFTLSPPWDLLNEINLSDVVLEMNLNQDSGGAWFDINKDLGFFDLHSVGIFYQKARHTTPKSLHIKLAGSLLAVTYTQGSPLQWNPLTQPAPAVPGKGNPILALRYLGLGQHISFKSTAGLSTVYEVLDKLGDAYHPVTTNPAAQPMPPANLPHQVPAKKVTGNPLAALKALQYNANAGILFGTDFTLLETVTVGTIFNDPNLYGLYLALSGKKAKSFAGLSFQILYKKITDSLGEYYLQLKLPTAMRHLQFGEVAITLPVVSVAVYTNGDFDIDLGFPYHRDFSQSFGLQAFPFVGAGGFYFAVLDGATSTMVPKTTLGRFDPVIQLGFGLQVGVGKSIQEGILNAGLTLTVEGILQGAFSFFHPNNKSLPSDFFYDVQGIAAIVGRLWGHVNFVVINANVEVLLYATARVTFESHDPIHLQVSCGVSVEVSVKVLFIHIHLSFHTTIHESFTIGSQTPAPWNTPPTLPHHHKSLYAASQSTLGENIQSLIMEPTATELASEHFQSPHSQQSLGSPNTWTRFSYFGIPQILKIYWVPVITQANDEAQCVMQLVIPTQKPDPGTYTPATISDFDYLCQALLVWGLGNHLGKTNKADLQKAKVNANDCRDLFQSIDGIDFQYSDFVGFLKDNLKLHIEARPSGKSASAVDSAVFAMIPDITLGYYDSGKQTRTFNNYHSTSPSYFGHVYTFIQTLQSHNIIPPAAPSSSEAISTFVFNDYCLMIIKNTVQAATNTLKNYPALSTTSKALYSLAKDYAADTQQTTIDTMVNAIALANQFDTKCLDTSGQLTISNFNYVIRSSNTFSTIATKISQFSTTAISAKSLASANQFNPNLLEVGQKVNISTLDYTVPSALTLSDLATQFHTDAGAITCLSSPVKASAGGSENLLPLSVYQINAIRYPVTNSITLTQLAEKFAVLPALIVNVNPTVNFSQPVTQGNINIPPITYVVPPNDVNSISRYFSVKSSDILNGTSPAHDPIPAGTQLTINGANKTISPCESLISLSQYLCTTVDTVVDDNTHLQLMLNQNLLCPSFSYNIRTGDSLHSIAQTFSQDLLALVQDNAQQIIIKAKYPWIVPEATVEVPELLATLSNTRAPHSFANVAGMVSRFMLHGLRLPNPSATFSDPVAQWKTDSLYALTGQQIPISATHSDFTMSVPANESWIQFKASGGGLSDSGSLSLSQEEISIVETIVAATQDINFSQPTAMSPYQQGPERFTFQHPIPWQCPNTLSYQNPSTTAPASASPVIWPVPKKLSNTLLALTASHSLGLSLNTGQHRTGSDFETRQEDNTIWASMLKLTIKQIPQLTVKPMQLQSDATTRPTLGTAMIPGTYELAGIDSESQQILEQLLNSNSTGDIQSLHFLLPDTNASGQKHGLSSDATSGNTAIELIKTNLASSSTQSHSLGETLYDVNQHWVPSNYFTDDSPAHFSPHCSSPDPFSLEKQAFSDGSIFKSAYVIDFTATAGYGGVAWALPAHITSSLPPDANMVTFWAVGAKGGEKILFSVQYEQHEYQVILTLTGVWTQYQIPFTHAVPPPNGNTTPFVWTATASDNNDQPFTFAIGAGPEDIQLLKTTPQSVHPKPSLPSSATHENPLAMLQLIWEQNAVQLGGYYLSYFTEQHPQGLPASLFSHGDEAELQLLVIYQSAEQDAQSFHNCVVTANPIDLSRQVFFAEAESIIKSTPQIKPGQIAFTCSETA